MNILLTGGAGYIGSHTYLALMAAGHKPVILDDFSNSSPAVLDRLAILTGEKVLCERGDVIDSNLVETLIRQHNINAVVHFAGFKAVGESVNKPLLYYRNNVGGLIGLLGGMTATDCRALVYSSSATVYSAPAAMPITEDAGRNHSNPYGHTKLVGEEILASLKKAEPDWRIAVLRYFNPVGADPSGLIGEDPTGVPNNLMPYATQVALGLRPSVNIFGSDYPTPDGTGIRDYIHVADLADGHVAALKVLSAKTNSFTVNLGTGRGYSVLEVIAALEQASGRLVPYVLCARREGDIAECWANPSRAEELLSWRARRSLPQMCEDAWNWQQRNPHGYNNGYAPTVLNPKK